VVAQFEVESEALIPFGCVIPSEAVFQAEREPALSKRAQRARRMGISHAQSLVPGEIPRPAGNNAGRRDDADEEPIRELSHDEEQSLLADFRW